MKSLLILVLLALLWVMPCFGQEKIETSGNAASNPDPHPYTQILTLQAGPFHPTAISIANSQYTFDYTGQSLNSYLIEPGWAVKLFHLLGSVYLEENLAFSGFKGTIAAGNTQSPNDQSVSLLMMGFDTRLQHAWEWFPWHPLVPFVEAGYQQTFYWQTGATDVESVQGTVGNFVTGAGFNLWVNRPFLNTKDAVERYTGIPIFITAKWNYIFSRNSAVDLGGSTLLGGISVGL